MADQSYVHPYTMGKVTKDALLFLLYQRHSTLPLVTIYKMDTHSFPFPSRLFTVRKRIREAFCANLLFVSVRCESVSPVNDRSANQFSQRTAGNGKKARSSPVCLR